LITRLGELRSAGLRAAGLRSKMEERPRQDSNLRHRLRRAVLYPLSYEGKGDERSAPAQTPHTAAGPRAGAG
jgi:hypothetical protein